MLPAEQGVVVELFGPCRLTIACSGQVLGAALICLHLDHMFEGLGRSGGPLGGHLPLMLKVSGGGNRIQRGAFDEEN